jgi:hypothetical protein
VTWCYHFEGPLLILFLDQIYPIHTTISLSQAIEEGKYNLTAGKYVHPKTGELLTLTEAENAGIVKCDIDPDQRCKVAKILERLNKLMDTSVPSADSPFSDGKMSLEEAIRTGVLDLQKGLFIISILPSCPSETTSLEL